MLTDISGYLAWVPQSGPCLQGLINWAVFPVYVCDTSRRSTLTPDQMENRCLKQLVLPSHPMLCSPFRAAVPSFRAPEIRTTQQLDHGSPLPGRRAQASQSKSRPPVRSCCTWRRGAPDPLQQTASTTMSIATQYTSEIQCTSRVFRGPLSRHLYFLPWSSVIFTSLLGGHVYAS